MIEKVWVVVLIALISVVTFENDVHSFSNGLTSKIRLLQKKAAIKKEEAQVWVEDNQALWDRAKHQFETQRWRELQATCSDLLKLSPPEIAIQKIHSWSQVAKNKLENLV